MIGNLVPSIFLIILLFAGSLYAETSVHIGSTTVSIPSGWIELKKEEDWVAYRSEIGVQNVTLSSFKFQEPLLFDEFKEICSTHAQHSSDGVFIKNETSFRDNNVFRCFFTVKNEGPSRITSTYLAQKDNELITIDFDSFYFNNDQPKPAEHLEILKLLSSKVFLSEDTQQ